MQLKIIANHQHPLTEILLNGERIMSADKAATDKYFDTFIILSDYQELTQSSYVKDMLSCVVLKNNNSTWVTSSLSINTPPSDRSLRQPVFLPKFNFRRLLSAKQSKTEGVFELTLQPHIIQDNSQKIISLSAILQCDGETIANLEQREIFRELAQELLQKKPPLSNKQLWQNIRDLQPMRLPGLKTFPPAIRRKLELLGLAHMSIQDSLIKNFKNYLEQLKMFPKMPLTLRAALALEACQNEALNNNDQTLRVIEDITYLADRVFNQDISGKKLDLPQNNGQALAIIAEYFTLEDILQIYCHLPEASRRSLVFISAWEPDFIPQETKLTSKTIRNDDAQELCSLLELGYYISDETVEKFQSENALSPELVLSILDRDALHNGNNRYTGGIIVVNKEKEVKNFVKAFTQLFKPNPEYTFERRQFHKREQILGKIYGKFVRRLFTHHKPAKMLADDSRQYEKYIREALEECLSPALLELLTGTDRENLQVAVKVLTAKTAAEQKELKEYVASRAHFLAEAGGYSQINP
ncbi:MAG: hypothetical protein LBJ25_08105 [Candidatus Margulisbacteria bacterium]|jgi:hypothetical protein|nr:hypothetical protein [Candidatus Margulisiibacteriota bacterium]